MSQNPNDTFNKSLKPLCMEEFVDYYFYRRLAIRLVPLLARLRLSPNHVTTISLLFGLAGAMAVLHMHFVLASLLAVISIVFDCCDGQLARLTNQFSPFGRMLDGVFDFVWVTAYWLAIYFSGYFQVRGYTHILLLMIVSALSMMVHCWRFDGIKLKAVELIGEATSEKEIDIPQAKRLIKEELRRFNIFAVLLLLCFIFQMYFFVRGSKQKRVYQRTPQEIVAVRARVEPVISKLTWIGEGHHNTLVILGTLVAPFSPYGLIFAFWFIFIPMNLWLLLCELDWQRTVASLLDSDGAQVVKVQSV